jgi:hypothetical protein
MNKTLIVGAGEIGNSLDKILGCEYETRKLDKGDAKIIGDFEYMHICFPYSEEFIGEVKKYKQLYKPKYTIIHSTVPVGTSRKCQCWHSPVVGIHPHLEEGLKTFTKFIGGENRKEVIDYFRRAGLKVYQTDKQETTELMKISSTTFYGVCIEYVKELKNECDKNSIPFEMWTLWTENYNKGYKELRHEEYMRPNLIPTKGKIGGHCVVSNTSFINNKFTKLIKDANK